MAKESLVEKAVCKHAQTLGFLVYKFVSPGQKGVPDRLFLRKGHVIFVEFKAPGEAPDPMQEEQHKRLRDAGFQVEVIDTIGTGMMLIGSAGDDQRYRERKAMKEKK